MTKTEKHKLPWVVNPIFQNQFNVIDNTCEDVCDFWVYKKDTAQAERVEDILFYVNNYDLILQGLKLAYNNGASDELKIVIDKLLSVNN